MQKNKVRHEEDKLINLFLLIGLVIGIWLISWWAVNKIPSTTDRGTFGDQFGVVNALFSGLALAGIIYSILLQKKELSLQRIELKETRQEFAQQNFENTFFNLLKNQQDITNKIDTQVTFINSNPTDTRTDQLTGLNFFHRSKRELSYIILALKMKKHFIYDAEYFYNLEPTQYAIDEPSENYSLARDSYTNYFYEITKTNWEESRNYNKLKYCRLAYAIFFRKYQYAIGHYFRHLYHIFKFLNLCETRDLDGVINETEINQIKKNYLTYAQFVQAQMSSSELMLLYYNSLAYPKMKMLLLKFQILENLSIEHLVGKVNVIPEVKLKTIKTLFEITDDK